MKLAISVVFAALSGCGTVPEKETAAPAQEEQQQASVEDDDTLYIQEGQPLPICDREGKLIYVKAEKTFKVCAANGWTNVDITGPKGDSGESVEISQAPESLTTCIANTKSINSSKVILKTEVTLMANGDRMVFVSAGSPTGSTSAVRWIKAGNSTKKIRVDHDFIATTGVDGFFEIIIDNTTNKFNEATLTDDGNLTWSKDDATCEISAL